MNNSPSTLFLGGGKVSELTSTLLFMCPLWFMSSVRGLCFSLGRLDLCVPAYCCYSGLFCFSLLIVSPLTNCQNFIFVPSFGFRVLIYSEYTSVSSFLVFHDIKALLHDPLSSPERIIAIILLPLATLSISSLPSCVFLLPSLSRLCLFE